MAVVAVLLNHMDKNAVVVMKPNINLYNIQNNFFRFNAQR